MQYGGGIAVDMHVTNATIMDSIFAFNTAHAGGGIYVNEGNDHLTLNRVSVSSRVYGASTRWLPRDYRRMILRSENQRILSLGLARS